MLGQMDAVVTTDHRAFYEDVLEKKEAQRVGKDLKGVTEKAYPQ